VTDEGLLADLKQAATPPPPTNFRPGVTFEGRAPSEITTGPMPLLEGGEYDDAVRAAGFPLPEDCTLVLVEMQMTDNPAVWHRDPEDKGQKHTAYTAPEKLWRYRFRVIPKSARHDEDIAALMNEARSRVPDLAVPERSGVTSRVINLADFQVGKVDELGGTAEMLARSEAALAVVAADLAAHPVDQIILVDPGDSTEGFESSPTANRTNDLQQTEQIRVWRRILWRWIDALAPLTNDLVVIGVPSNHCRVRSGKNALGHALDDWGIEVMAQVSDIAAVNPEAYGHVRFIVPNEHEEHVLFTLVGGLVLGVVHGHQKNSPAQLAGWIKSTGRRGLAQADIVVVGHFHHLVVEAFGDMQWLFICPTNDNGSSWFTPSSGERSEPGILTFSVDRRGWFDLEPVWLGNIA
jgi:hypothetical protein